MEPATIDRLILNSPYEEPETHWKSECGPRLFDLSRDWRPADDVKA